MSGTLVSMVGMTTSVRIDSGTPSRSARRGSLVGGTMVVTPRLMRAMASSDAGTSATIERMAMDGAVAPAGTVSHASNAMVAIVRIAIEPRYPGVAIAAAIRA